MAWHSGACRSGLKAKLVRFTGAASLPILTRRHTATVAVVRPGTLQRSHLSETPEGGLYMQHDDNGRDDEAPHAAKTDDSTPLPSDAAGSPNPFRLFWGLGYRRLVPIVPPDAELSPNTSLAKRPGNRGKAVGLKGAGGWYGFNWHVTTTTEEDLDRWHAMGAGVGIRTGEGLIGLDIDSLSKTWAVRIIKLAHEMLGPASWRIGQAPKALLPYRVRAEDIDAVGYRVVLFDDGTAFEPSKRPRVELLSTGRQLVAAGIHSKTGKPYVWPDGIPAYDELTEVSAEQIGAFFAALAAMLPDAIAPRVGAAAPDRRNINQATLKGSSVEIRELAKRIPNDVPDYDGYCTMAAAFRGASQDEPDEGFEIFREWSERWDGEVDATEDQRVYWSLRSPFGLGIDLLRARASRAAGEVLTPPELFFTPIADGDEPDTSAFSVTGAAGAPVTSSGSARPPLRFQTLGACATGALTEGTAPLIKGLLDQGAMTVLYGESNVGKTFVAMDVAFHVACGLAWAGMKTTRAGVAYVAAEGGRGASRRGLALIRKYGDCDGFHILREPVDLLRANADLHPLIEAIRGLGGVGLVVIDTLSRALAGGDENSSTDMGALVKHLDAIRSAVSAHLLIVHHTGKDRAKGARGHSLLRAATDTEIEVGDGQIKVTKQRDLEKAWASPFTLDTVTLGADADGDPITSCTVRLVARQAELPQIAPTPKESGVLAALQSILARTKCPADPKAVAVELGDGTTGDQARYHLRMLEDKRLIVRVGRGKWQPARRSADDPAAYFSAIPPENSAFESGGNTALPNVFH
ncbi:AAA family ATPase [Methylorubrum extorquens]|uniref:AAA family ATPase n=1 Tax=Methylorubrum extorquens TaxID=408 RepID=UPI003F61388F